MPLPTSSKSWQILEGHVLDVLPTLPAGHFHCCTTSPPYYLLRDYGIEGQLGLEKTPEEYVGNIVLVYREIRRVLRDDGCAWLNIGDSFNAYNGGAGPGSKLSQRQSKARPQLETGFGLQVKSLKPKDMIGIPWLLAFALRADGWFLRSEVIWAKSAPMPESITGWEWRRCGTKDPSTLEFTPCDGCRKCSENDGLVLKRGGWRPTKAHEQVFLLAKSEKYFAALDEQSVSDHGSGNGFKRAERLSYQDGRGPRGNDEQWQPVETRNARSVWHLGPESFGGGHFATMPTELARRCLLAGTSEKGCCPSCGTCWAPVVERDRMATRPGTNSKVGKREAAISAAARPGRPSDPNIVGNRDPQRHVTNVKVTGWRPACRCNAGQPAPCRVLDPFSGAGTTALVARRLGLHATGIELNPEYAAMSRKRILDDAPLFNATA